MEIKIALKVFYLCLKAILVLQKYKGKKIESRNGRKKKVMKGL